MGNILIFAPQEEEPQVIFIYTLSQHDGLPVSLTILEDNLLIGTSKGRILIFAEKPTGDGIHIIGEAHM